LLETLFLDGDVDEVVDLIQIENGFEMYVLCLGRRVVSDKFYVTSKEFAECLIKLLWNDSHNGIAETVELMNKFVKLSENHLPIIHEAIPRLVNLLKATSNNYLKRVIIRIFGEIRSPETKNVLVNYLLKSKSKDICEAARISLSRFDCLSEDILISIKNKLEGEKDNSIKFTLAMTLLKEEGKKSLGLNILNEMVKKNELNNLQKNKFNKLVEETNIKEDFKIAYKIISEHPDNQSKNELEKTVHNIEDRINSLLNQELDNMSIKGKQVDLDRLERIAKIARHEFWWKRNSVQLIGFTLTFIAALLAAIAGFYKGG